MPLTLRYRRHRGDMIEVFKILRGICDKDITDVTDGILRLAHNDKLKPTIQSSRLGLRRNCFSVRVLKPRNSLPEARQA